MKEKYLIAILFAILLFFGWLVAGEVLQQAAKPVIWTLVGVLMLTLLVIGWIIIETARTRKSQLLRDRKIAVAETLQAEAEAAQKQVMVITAPKGHQLVVRDADPDSHYRQLHLNPMPVVNAHYEQPTDLQIGLYREYQSSGSASSGNELVIDQPPDIAILDQFSPDWMQKLILPAPHVHYCGPTLSGKTTLANHQLTHIRQNHQNAQFYLLNPKHTAARKPFIVEPDYNDISQAIEGLQVFNGLLHKRKNDPNLSRDSYKIVFIIDEWDWIHQVYRQQAVSLLTPLVKVGADLNIQVILIGQSPLTGDTGLSSSFYHNMVRVAIWSEGTRLLNNYPLDKKYKAPLTAQYEQLKNLAQSYENQAGHLLRYCVVIPMTKNPSVQVIPMLSDPETIKQKRLAATTEKPNSDEMKVFLAWRSVVKNDRPSWNKLHHLVTGTTTNISQSQRIKYLELFEKYGIEPHL
jgi:hypothetical protein